MRGLLVRLFGGWVRDTPAVGGCMSFWTRRGADRYPGTAFGSIDPYTRGMGPAYFMPGRFLRREAR